MFLNSWTNDCIIRESNDLTNKYSQIIFSRSNSNIKLEEVSDHDETSSIRFVYVNKKTLTETRDV